MTGSGKTYLTKRLLSKVQRLIVVDPKAKLDDWDTMPFDREAYRLLADGHPVRTRVIPDERVDPEDLYNRAFAIAYEVGDVAVYIDELYGAVPPGGRPSPVLSALYTRGREFGIGVWAATQRPVWVPLFALSESQHFFTFYLQLSEDRARMAAFQGEAVLEKITDAHGFFYSRAQDREPTYYPAYQEVTK